MKGRTHMSEENKKMIPYPYDRVFEFWNDVFHDENYDGIIFLCGKTKEEKFFTIRVLARHELNEYLKTFKILPNMDYYFTTNHYFKKKGGTSRRSENFFAATCTVIDIDIHDKRISQDHIDKTLTAYKAKLDTFIALGEAFPYHYCVNSGRGLQFVYIYDRAINFKLLLMHKRMQELILRQHSQLLADNPEIEIKLDSGTTKKLSGVYRMPGTYNTKVHKQVTYTKTDYRYLDTSKIIDEYGFFDEPKGPHRVSTHHNNPNFKGSQKGKSRNNISHYRKMINAVYQYQEDHYATRQNPGHENRNCTCFVLIHLLLVIMPYDEVLKEILAFNHNFDVPLSERRIKSMVDYAYENYLDEKKYRMRFLKTSTILTLLNLENGEYGIVDNSEKRKKLEEERTIKRDQREKRDELICSLYLQGIDRAEIIRQAHCSYRTISRVTQKYRQGKKSNKETYEKIAQLYLTGMPYDEIAKEVSVSKDRVNHIIAKVYPKETRPRPWRDVGMKKEDFYEQYKRNHS